MLKVAALRVLQQSSCLFSHYATFLGAVIDKLGKFLTENLNLLDYQLLCSFVLNLCCQKSIFIGLRTANYKLAVNTLL